MLAINTTNQTSSDINALIAILKPYLDTVTRIYAELDDLKVTNREDWLYERYSELRKLAKIVLS